MILKEVLKKYIDFCYDDSYPNLKGQRDYEERFEKLTNRFIEQFYKEYYEVEFIKKGNPEIDYCYEELERARVADEESYADDPNPKLTKEEKNFYLDKENK